MAGIGWNTTAGTSAGGGGPTATTTGAPSDNIDWTSVINNGILDSASWTKDGTVQNSQGLDKFLYSVAYDGATRDYQRIFGQPYDPTNANAKSWMDQQTQKNYQEVGEGAQGQTMSTMYSKGLTADQVNNAYSGNTTADNAIAYLNSGGSPTPDIQKLIDSGAITKTSSMGPTPDGNSTETTTWVAGKPQSGQLISQPVFNHSPQTGANTGSFGFDPNRGFVTTPDNFHSGGWEAVGNILPTLIASGMTFGAGAAIGAVGGSATLLSTPLGNISATSLPQLAQTASDFFGNTGNTGGVASGASSASSSSAAPSTPITVPNAFSPQSGIVNSASQPGG